MTQGFIQSLYKFVSQANTDNLKTKSYPSKLGDLKIKTSFGQGNAARIPWIALLKEPNKVSQGIYPVYLYFKSLQKVILAFGVSETEKPKVGWNNSKSITITEYFQNHNLAKPERYGNSFVSKVYEANSLPNENQLEKDLMEVLNAYNQIEFDTSKKIDEPDIKNTQEFSIDIFINSLLNSKLIFQPSTVERFLASLLTKPFLILSGLSGSGKTKLAHSFAEWISEDEDQIVLIPVGADWTNREPLLGYVNGLEANKYVKPESGALDLILRAHSKPEKPYFLILDEMNLSHVERYFADFLSVMESGKEIKLHSSETEMSGVPSTISLPKNLFIIGTVNIDETTYMFSPKVLDRANVIEFRVNEIEIEQFLSDIKPVDMNALKSKGASMGASFLELSGNTSFENEDSEKISKVLVSLFKCLSEIGAEFGYRSASEIVRLINQLRVLDTSISTEDCLDIAIMQKLLPKLHGSRRKLVFVLKVLAQLCIKEEIKDIEKDLLAKSDFNLQDRAVVSYPISLEKIKRMYKNAVEHGFASYAEA